MMEADSNCAIIKHLLSRKQIVRVDAKDTAIIKSITGKPLSEIFTWTGVD